MNNTSGHSVYVTDIERFAIHDGPGIRTVIFMQGCPLRCPWCANPESWYIKPRLMYIESKCAKCARCVSACHLGVINLAHGRLEIDRANCDKCLVCAQTCPNGAIHFAGKTMSAAQIIDIVLRDKEYYVNSGGGVTLSGGEPFQQFESAVELLTQSKEAGLHTAVETTGHVEWSLFKEAIPLVDLFLFDIKHCDPAKLKEVTNGNIDLILHNLHAAAERDPEKVVLRVPVIPQFNNDSETINGIFQIASNHNIKTVHLLPYHTLGKNKFSQLGMKYPYDEELPMLRKENLLPFYEIGKKKGLKVQMGG